MPMQKSFEHLFGLSGTLWPVHLKPLPDELLSSWLVRLAHANLMKAQTMCRLLFGADRNVWARDVDKFVPDWLGAPLMRVTGATVEQFEQSTLRSFEGIVAETVNVNGIARGIVPLGVFHRTRRRTGLMWCPLCLREDKIPYFRKSWRVAYSTVCVKHQVYLEDACPVCSAPIVPHRSDIGYIVSPTQTLIVHCFRCRSKLSEFVPTVADATSAHLQATFDLAISQGFIRFGLNPSLYSVLFFDGIRALISTLISKRSAKRWEAARQFAGVDVLPNGSRGAGWEAEPLIVRREIMIVAAKLLERWPLNFVSIIRECNFRHCDLRSYGGVHPYWFDSVIDWEAGRYYPSIGTAHAESIALAVERRYGKFSNALARQLSGHDVLQLVPYRRAQLVSHEIYRKIICSLNVEIANVTILRVRAELIRDKVMFITGRVYGLSTTELSRFTLQKCRELTPDFEKTTMRLAPTTIVQARAWIEWYFEHVRPQLNPCAAERALFVSTLTGRALKKSAISLRFCRAILQADIGKSIVNYEMWKIKPGK